MKEARQFQKLSQARNSGIVVVNQPAVEDSRPGRSLGLGYKTGSNPSGQRGSRIVSNRNAGSEGIHTAGGLARAMQERGTGVSDAFLLAPTLASASTSTGRTGGAGRNKKVRGVGGGASITTNSASRHKALVLGSRPGRKQAGNGGGAQPPQQSQQQQQKGGKVGKASRGGAANRPAVAATATVASGKKKKGVAAVAVGGKGTKAIKGGKGGKAKPARLNAENLDSELNEYMMKDEQTAASLLDNDLDSYMADKPQDGTW
ncbi:hypothetical protein BGX20_000395 [Mortierella sp. AD010]|nr:hypothetical protein BGX20_000395 [Mortierella sp. AD010]